MKVLSRYRKQPQPLVQVCKECERGHIRPRYRKGARPIWNCNHCHIPYVPTT